MFIGIAISINQIFLNQLTSTQIIAGGGGLGSFDASFDASFDI